MKGFIEDRVLFYRNQLEEYIRVRPVFRESLTPVEDDALAPVMARRMIVAAADLGVGPMATVAGALAEHVGNDISLFSDEYVIENGGDISLSTRQERVVLIYAGDSPFSGRIGIKVRPDERPYGICTSSATVGPSLSFGKADAVCVVARSALFADGLATKVGNMVKRKEDLSRAIDEGKNFPGVLAVLVVLGDHIGMWGDMELVRI